MRGLWLAAWLAPALVSADWMVNDLQDQDITSTTIDVPVPGLSVSPDIPTVLSFRVDVLASDQICGFGNLTINDQELAQEPFEAALIGKGSINVEGKIIEGSWAFFCLNGLYGLYAQRLDFSVLSVDGKAVEGVAFWVEFKQNDDRRILSTSASDDDSTLLEALPDQGISAYEDNTAYDDFIDFENYDIEGELAELDWMKNLVEDFEYQIFLKEEAIALYLSEENLDACDSLKCVIRTVYSKARVTVHKVITKVYSKLSGDVESEEGKGPPWKKPHGKKPHWRKPHWRKPHWRRPHWRKPPFPPPRHGNHSHGNHTCPGKGNHTHPHFPHRRPPPFCHCPPPRHCRRPPHGPPPHRPPHHGPPHHGPPPHGPPHHGPPKGPPGKRPPPPPHDGPPKSPPGKAPGGPPDRHPGPPEGDQGPPFDGSPFDGPPMDGPPDFDSPPFDGPPFNGPGSLSGFDGPRFGRKLHKIKTAVTFFAVATLLFLLVAVIHRRCCCCSPARRQEKQARREERRRRRAFRRAAHKHAWRSWFARHICRFTAYDDLDEEEKRAMLAGRPTEGQEDAIASEISELSNAASVVSDMIAAEEGRMEGRVSMDSRSSLPEYMSELGGEPLPTYEDEEGPELSSVVADGFRYTPGSSEYTPGTSAAGSVRDVLGDVKE